MTDRDPEKERRRYPRVKAPILCRAARLFSSRRQVTNIGLGGVRVYSDEKMKIDQRLEIELFLPDKTSLTCTVRVVWLMRMPDSAPAKYDVGFEFLRLPSDGTERLRQIIEMEL